MSAMSSRNPGAEILQFTWICPMRARNRGGRDKSRKEQDAEMLKKKRDGGGKKKAEGGC